MLPAIGSTMTHAISFPRLSNSDLSECFVVEWKHGSQFGQALRHTWTVRQTKRRNAGAGLHEQTVAMAVVAAVEFDDAFAAREASRQADRAHRGFGSRIDQPDFSIEGKNLCDQLREFDLTLGRRPETMFRSPGPIERRRELRAIDDRRSGAP